MATVSTPLGPPIPSAPWSLLQVPGFPVRPLTVPLIPPALPPGTVRGKLLIERVPEAQQRLRRFTDKVSGILNSLITQGILYQVEALSNTWSIDLTATTSGSTGITGTFGG